MRTRTDDGRRDPHPPEAGHHRPLLFAFILGDVLGAGIYALMDVLAAEVGGMLWAPLIVALLLALLTAGSYAELGAVLFALTRWVVGARVA